MEITLDEYISSGNVCKKSEAKESNNEFRSVSKLYNCTQMDFDNEDIEGNESVADQALFSLQMTDDDDERELNKMYEQLNSEFKTDTMNIKNKQSILEADNNDVFNAIAGNRSVEVPLLNSKLYENKSYFNDKNVSNSANNNNNKQNQNRQHNQRNQRGNKHNYFKPYNQNHNNRNNHQNNRNQHQNNRYQHQNNDNRNRAFNSANRNCAMGNVSNQFEQFYHSNMNDGMQQRRQLLQHQQLFNNDGKNLSLGNWNGINCVTTGINGVMPNGLITLGTNNVGGLGLFPIGAANAVANSSGIANQFIPTTSTAFNNPYLNRDQLNSLPLNVSNLDSVNIGVNSATGANPHNHNVMGINPSFNYNMTNGFPLPTDCHVNLNLQKYMAGNINNNEATIVNRRQQQQHQQQQKQQQQTQVAIENFALTSKMMNCAAASVSNTNPLNNNNVGGSKKVNDNNNTSNNNITSVNNNIGDNNDSNVANEKGSIASVLGLTSNDFNSESLPGLISMIQTILKKGFKLQLLPQSGSSKPK